MKHTKETQQEEEYEHLSAPYEEFRQEHGRDPSGQEFQEYYMKYATRNRIAFEQVEINTWPWDRITTRLRAKVRSHGRRV